MDRRRFMVGTGAVILTASQAPMVFAKGDAMYGLIGKMTAIGGKRDDLANILLNGISGMPGCRSYIIALDPADEVTLWVTEVWDSADSHKASLSLPSVQEAIRLGRPMIAGMESIAKTAPIGGQGL